MTGSARWPPDPNGLAPERQGHHHAGGEGKVIHHAQPHEDPDPRDGAQFDPAERGLVRLERLHLDGFAHHGAVGDEARNIGIADAARADGVQRLLAQGAGVAHLDGNATHRKVDHPGLMNPGPRGIERRPVVRGSEGGPAKRPVVTAPEGVRRRPTGRDRVDRRQPFREPETPATGLMRVPMQHAPARPETTEHRKPGQVDREACQIEGFSPRGKFRPGWRILDQVPDHKVIEDLAAVDPPVPAQKGLVKYRRPRGRLILGGEDEAVGVHPTARLGGRRRRGGEDRVLQEGMATDDDRTMQDLERNRRTAARPCPVG